MNRYILLILYFLLLSFLLSQPVFAQSTTEEDLSGSSSGKNVIITGDIGLYGELYSMSGQERRRPSSTGRIFFRPTLTLFNMISIPFDFFISTEGSSARQNLNRFGITPSWDWGTAYLGDFSLNYSDYTLNGISIRGAGVNINPGIFRFSTVSGFTQRTVTGGASNGSFKRFLFGTKIGIGKEEDSFVDLILIKLKDEIEPITSGTKSINVIEPNGNDELPAGTIQPIRWGSVNINGNVNIEISRDGGATFQSIVNDQSNNGYYEWTVTGPETFQALIKITSVEDSVSDVSDAFFRIGFGINAKKGNLFSEYINPFAVTPQENLVIGTAGKIQIAEEIALRFELTGSAHSKDLRAEVLDYDSIGLPKFLDGIYKSRNGSSADYALKTEANFNFEGINSRLGFRSIGAGYTSLGLSYLINDQREYFASASFRISRASVNLNYNRINDNLEDQKRFTTVRSNYGASVNGNISDFWNAGIFINFLNMGNDSRNDTTKTDFTNLILGTTQVFFLGQESFLRSISASYNFQTSDNKSVLLEKGTTSIHSVNLGLAFILSQSLSLNTSAGLVSSVIFDTLKNTTQNFSIGVQHRALENKLNSSITLSNSFLESSNVIRTFLNFSYSISGSDLVSLIFSAMNFRGSSGRNSRFDEIITSLTYSHRF